eukprot:GFUD01016439.1.p1 GENE.GFUD01016439.1~~GFUD01016439.1.p1  ORF type:complete len:543 (+),score=126.92 GFUD01016439.1:40-1668(+)
MSEKLHILSAGSVGIFQGDNIIVEDEFQPDEARDDRDDCDDPSEVIDYAIEGFEEKREPHEESLDEPIVYTAEVIDASDPSSSEFWFFNSDSPSDDQAGQGQSEDQLDHDDQIMIEQSLIISNFDIDPIQHSKVIHIDTKSDLSKPSVSGLNVAGGSVNFAKKHHHDLQTVFLCPEQNCKLKLPSRSSLVTHVKMCHKERDAEADMEQGDDFLSDENNLPDGVEGLTEDSDLERTDLEEISDNRVKVSKSHKVKSIKAARKLKMFECHYCGFITDSGAATLRKHVKEVHEEIKQYHCTECGIKVSRKYHLIRHIKAVHHKEKFWQCEDCDYKTNNQVCFKKHKQNKHEGGGDCDSKYSVESLQCLPGGLTEADLKCVCTWCVFKSNKYSVVKKHIEIHHERKKHYPCKECVFVGQNVDDYAEHYHTFHKTDSYPHACTDCSFKCTNKHDLKQHYSDTHSKQRLYVCKMCDHKSNDVNNMKRHINTVHSSRKSFKCENCNYETDQKMEFLGHKYNVHGLSMAGITSDDMKVILFNAHNEEEGE